MTTDQDRKLAEDFVERRRALILQLQESKGLKASGKSAALLHTAQPTDNITQLIDGSGYFEFQDFGRAFGKFPPFRVIYEWLAHKKYGLEWKDDKERRALAWRIMVTIARKGTYTFRTRPTGVLTEAVNDQALRELLGALSKSKGKEVSSDIKRLF